jgi:hypothetical protein
MTKVSFFHDMIYFRECNDEDVTSLERNVEESTRRLKGEG